LAFLALFALSFAIHALGGWRESNQDLFEHGQPPASLEEFLTGSEFWFQSFQNWQSEFLAVLAIVVLSIFSGRMALPRVKTSTHPIMRMATNESP